MTNKTTIGIGLIAVVALVLGFVAVNKTPINTTTEVTKNVGSVTSPDILSDYISVNGLSTYQYKKNLALATTTPCVFKSPSATSTLDFANVMITTSSTTATVWTFAKATTAYATTTLLGTVSLGSGAKGSMTTMASTTGADSITEVAPNTYVVIGMAGVLAPTSDKLLGTCSAKFVMH